MRVNRIESREFDIVLPKVKKIENEEKTDKSSDESSEEFVVEQTPRPTQTQTRGRGRGRGRGRAKTTPTRSKRNPF